MVSHARAQHRGRQPLVAQQVHHAGAGPKSGVVEGGRIGFLAAESIAADGANDQLGLAFEQALVIESVLAPPAGQQVRDHDLGAVDDPEQGVACFTAGQIQKDRSLAPILHLKGGYSGKSLG